MKPYINADPAAVDHGSKQIYANCGDIDAIIANLRGCQRKTFLENWGGRAASAQQVSYERWDVGARAETDQLRVHGEGLGTAGRTLENEEMHVKHVVGAVGSRIVSALNPPTAHA